MLTVVAYLVSVSTVAASLSAYYVFMWNPYAAGNSTQTTAGGGGGAEGIAMALRRVADDCVYADAEADRRHSGKAPPAVVSAPVNGYTPCTGARAGVFFFFFLPVKHSILRSNINIALKRTALNPRMSGVHVRSGITYNIANRRLSTIPEYSICRTV